MLVFGRKLDEDVMIGDEVRVTIVEIRGNSVRLGIDAPDHIKVHRGEIYKQIKQEEAESASQDS